MITSGLPRDLASLGIAMRLIPTMLGETRISLVIIFIIIVIIIKTLLIISMIRVVIVAFIISSVVPRLLLLVSVSILCLVFSPSCLLRVCATVRP